MEDRGPHKGGYTIVNCNLGCTYCPLVPKQDTFYVTDGSPMMVTGQCSLYGHPKSLYCRGLKGILKI